MWVTDNLFHVLGVPPLIGRVPTPEDAKPGAPPVVVLSFKTWQSKFGGDSGIVGRTLVLNSFGSPRRPTTVIGVMPPRFTILRGYSGGEVYLPATLSGAQTPEPTLAFSVVGHLKAGMTIE